MPFSDGRPPWDRFQGRIKRGISRAADEHDTVEMLLLDLRLCETFLREEKEPLETMRRFDSPAAGAISVALEEHAAEDPVRYDGVCAANVVLAAMSAIAREALEAES